MSEVPRRLTKFHAAVYTLDPATAEYVEAFDGTAPISVLPEPDGKIKVMIRLDGPKPAPPVKIIINPNIGGVVSKTTAASLHAQALEAQADGPTAILQNGIPNIDIRFTRHSVNNYYHPKTEQDRQALESIGLHTEIDGNTGRYSSDPLIISPSGWVRVWDTPAKTMLLNGIVLDLKEVQGCHTARLSQQDLKQVVGDAYKEATPSP